MHFKEIQQTRVPSIGLGTWQLSDAQARTAVDHALGLGYRHIDTAHMYGNETGVGRGLHESGVDRADVFLTTKVWFTNLSYNDTLRSTEESLRQLQTEYVDLLLIHWPNDAYPLERTLDAMLKLQDDGKARHIGVSNFPPNLLQRALGHAPIFCNQVEYHPFLDQHALLTLARRHDLLLTAYSPIARGRVFNEETLQSIAARHGKDPAQVALRWLIQQKNVAAIPRSSNPAHRASNFDVFDFTLTPEEDARIASLEKDRRMVDPEFGPEW